MCGIFGVSLTQQAEWPPKRLRAVVDDLFRLSESRGKEAAGIAVLSAEAIHVYKEAVRASTMIRRRQYAELFNGSSANGHRCATLRRKLASDLSRPGPPADKAGETPAPPDFFSTSAVERTDRQVTVVGHSRLVTTGVQENRLNNQPVINSGAVGIHNGIIVNDAELWNAHPSLERRGQVDSEVIVGLLREFLRETGSLAAAARKTFGLIKGAASIAVVFDDLDQMLLATNNGSLYHCGGAELGAMVFASEEYILRRLVARRHLAGVLGSRVVVTPVRPGEACLVDLWNLRRHDFRLDGPEGRVATVSPRGRARRIVDVVPADERPRQNGGPRRTPGWLRVKSQAAAAESCEEAIECLRRCTRCILPETMPFIEFDADGVCNYCRNYRKIAVRGVDELERLVGPYRSGSGRYDCLVGLSGGRDSTYGLHYIKTVLKMNPIAFTYDWGMVTDLARRNISRICGRLGVEHILVSADIETKRRYIRKNVLAWLRRPALGVIPLFMAGDKQYFYHASRLKKQMGVPVIFLCENTLERTDFKTGFAGVRPAVIDEDHVYTLRLSGKIRLAAYYGWQYLLNPSYLNSSVPDTLFAYACYYLIRRDFLNLYRFVEWDEQTVVDILLGEYDWELAPDTETTWRIGDGTASFYNYIYYTVAGFSEFHTLRSNQIREGKLTREEALVLARRENRPRFESIRWYLSTIGLGDAFESIIRRINEIPKRYPTGAPSVAHGSVR